MRQNSISAWLIQELKIRSADAEPLPFDVRDFKGVKRILQRFNHKSPIRWHYKKFTTFHYRVYHFIEEIQPPKPVVDKYGPYDDDNPERPFR